MPQPSKKTTYNLAFNAKTLKETNESLQQIATSLGFIILQMGPLKNSKNPKKIHFLSKFGFARNQIAAIIDSTPNTISKERSVLKRKRGTKKEDVKNANG
jgi:hypothetical protein